MFQELKYWRDNIGLLPIYLEHNQRECVHKYAMLDGDINNFCLDFLDKEDFENCRNNAWSANMHNYVSVLGDKVYLYRTSSNQVEDYDYSYVRGNISSFYKYLSIKTDNEPQGVVSFIMDEYEKIRTALREEQGKGRSLTTLLYMLTSVNHQIDNNNLKTYGLPSDTLDIVNSIKDNSLIGQIVDEVKKGVNGFVPDITLLLRHAAGRLFEEANFAATFSPQLTIFPISEMKYSYDPRMIGAFYTPTYIARSVVDYVLSHFDFRDKKEIVIFDPACGSGEFLIECLRQLKALGYKGKVKIIGYDISKSAVIIAKYILTFEALEWGENLVFNIEDKDSILANWPKADILFMNPLYSSWEQMNKDYTPYIREKLKIKNGRPNLASIFYHKAVRSLNEDGIVGCVMPTTFLYSSFTEPIRNSSLDYARPLVIARLGNFVFPKAYVDVCAVISKENEKSNRTTMVWTNNVDNIVPEALRQIRVSYFNNRPFHDNSNFSVYDVEYNEIKDKNIWLPLSYKMFKRKQDFEMKVHLKIFTQIGKIFDVKQGARTGRNKFLKISREIYDKLTDQEKKYFRPSIDGDSLQNNSLTIVNYLFFPYGENGALINTEEEFKNECPTFYNMIHPHKANLLGRSIGDKWWLLTRPREWQYKRFPKMVSGEFGNSNNFSIDSDGKFVVERGCYWKPIKDMKEDELLFYFGILSSSYFNELLAIYQGSLLVAFGMDLVKSL